ncbi:MAG: energy transducer TonB [Bacteroidales bacterium]|nr:energy transducer TonB [Bacteroidales bacterium]
MTKKDKHKLYGILATVAFHAIAVVLLFNLCFRTPLPLPGEAGVEVNLGMYAEAMSQQDNMTTSQQVEETESQQVEESTSEDVEEEILSEDENIPSIEEVEETEEVEEIVEEVVEEKPVVNQRALFQVNKKKQETPSEGSSNEVVGEQGSPNGLKDIERYVGHGGSGDGPSYDLGGRGAKSISSPSKDISEEATIVVDIWVDKEGRVQRAEIGKGTTTTNSDMRASALQAARNSVFVKDDKAADLQKGTITYNFIIRQ